MRSALAILCLFAGATSAAAQYGVSSQRDMYGNLVRSTGTYAPKGINQGPVNNGPVSIAPAQPPTNNSRMDKGSGR
jgi:hypothetical protein